jgi:hypothetical protein
MSYEMIICDTPDKIQAYRYLALKGVLKLEVLTGLQFRFSPAKQIREIIGSPTKLKNKLLEEYIIWLKGKGYLK